MRTGSERGWKAVWVMKFPECSMWNIRERSGNLPEIGPSDLGKGGSRRAVRLRLPSAFGKHVPCGTIQKRPNVIGSLEPVLEHGKE